VASGAGAPLHFFNNYSGTYTWKEPLEVAQARAEEEKRRGVGPIIAVRSDVGGEEEDGEGRDRGADLEGRKEQFKAFLLEKGVTPGSSWEKELKKFCFDGRYKSILPNMADRRELKKFCFDARYKSILPNMADRRAVFQGLNRADAAKAHEQARKAGLGKKAAAAAGIKAAHEQARKAGLGGKATAADLDRIKEGVASLPPGSSIDDFWAKCKSDPRLASVDVKSC
ncbi:hypothetical protein T484DRAFT_1835464, partial [Baffinella frigidus]